MSAQRPDFQRSRRSLVQVQYGSLIYHQGLRQKPKSLTLRPNPKSGHFSAILVDTFANYGPFFT